MQTIVRKGTFDAGHRVMNERMKCYNIHGHTYLYEISFNFSSMQDIGYPIDFKEIKRIGCQWIDDKLDHGMILNPHDIILKDVCYSLNSKIWLMSLNGKDQYCNPTVENIAKEILLAMFFIFDKHDLINASSITLYETPNCYTHLTVEDVPHIEMNNWILCRSNEVLEYTEDKGRVEYDDRKS